MIPGLYAAAAGLAVIALASLTQGLTGFGFALVSIPLLLLFLPARSAVPLVLVESIVTNAAVLWSARKAVDLRLVWPLLLAGALGVPLGTRILLYLDAGALKSLIGAVIVVAGLAFLLGFHRPIRRQRLACVPIGFASGLLNGSTGMSGPPVVLFLANQEVAKETFRASLVAYFAALNLITVPGPWRRGRLPPGAARRRGHLPPRRTPGCHRGGRALRRRRSEGLVAPPLPRGGTGSSRQPVIRERQHVMPGTRHLSRLRFTLHVSRSSGVYHGQHNYHSRRRHNPPVPAHQG
jgi:uncharacterized membrane protein YfcA